VFISYPLAEHLWGTYHGDSSTIDKFLVKVIKDFMFNTDPDFEFNLSGYKWFIYDNECFEGHSFTEVLDTYWFEEDIQFGQFLIDYIITVDTNTVSRPNVDVDSYTFSNFNNHSSKDQNSCHKDNKFYEDLDPNFSWDYIRCRD
ncbi:13792_t:CDS:2, partial [Ambispora leptoticha]